MINWRKPKPRISASVSAALDDGCQGDDEVLEADQCRACGSRELPVEEYQRPSGLRLLCAPCAFDLGNLFFCAAGCDEFVAANGEACAACSLGSKLAVAS